MIRFFVPGLPIAQPRQRHAIIAGSVRNYTPANHPANVFKAAVALAAKSAYQGPLIEDPVELDLVFMFPRPQCIRWTYKPMPRVWSKKKPDLDNLAKCAADALNMVVWTDDAIVARLVVEKYICAGNESPGVHVTITRLEGVSNANNVPSLPAGSREVGQGDYAEVAS
jgi:Holliday junction resolvase RusA-like endonuclease